MHMFDVFKLIAIGRVVWKHRLGQKIVLCARSGIPMYCFEHL